MTKVTVNVHTISEKRPNNKALVVVVGYGEMYYNDTKGCWANALDKSYMRQVYDCDQWYPVITEHDIKVADDQDWRDRQPGEAIYV